MVKRLNSEDSAKVRSAMEIMAEQFTADLKASGMNTRDFVWMFNRKTGELMIYSAFGVKSREIADRLGIRLGDE